LNSQTRVLRECCAFRHVKIRRQGVEQVDGPRAVRLARVDAHHTGADVSQLELTDLVERAQSPIGDQADEER
jgi:hypothetical protein